MIFDDFIKEIFLNNYFNFKSDCIIGFDFKGKVLDINKNDNNEYILEVADKKGNIYHIGSNHPNLQINKL